MYTCFIVELIFQTNARDMRPVYLISYFILNITDETNISMMKKRRTNSINDVTGREAVIGKSADRNSVGNMQSLVRCNDKINISETVGKSTWRGSAYFYNKRDVPGIA